ncbi:MAG: tRNA 2-thiouridine(34) synthase MnmA [Elusimicrobiota bacterium]
MNGKKVAVAISGGVDSGTVLYLLKEKGYDVTAFYTEYFSCQDKSQTQKACCSRLTLNKARATAEFLDVPFYKLDLRDKFNSQVIEPFVEYYKKGLTPNPCVMCNERLRFSTLLRKIKALGMDYLVTGHYVRLEGTDLFKALDKTKDQSYFLYSVPKKVLGNVRFPLGNYRKSTVRKIAKDANLPVGESPESQDCCILKGNGLPDFLKRHIDMKEGNIIDREGNILGTHPGFQNFTIGQRRGFGGLGRKYYVVEIRPGQNEIVVGSERDLFKNRTEFKFKKENFSEKISPGEKYEIKLRSTHSGAGCTVESLDLKSNICKIKFNKKQRAPTPGQSAVLYKEDKIAGGGEILK